jgi:hypothetical protein
MSWHSCCCCDLCPWSCCFLRREGLGRRAGNGGRNSGGKPETGPSTGEAEGVEADLLEEGDKR